jgi:HPt (histidine-containing phosphotransfer) domain-containing protein
MLSEIENFNEETLFDYRIKVHGIKGACLDIYADQVGKEAKALEDAAKNGDIEYITKHNPAFLESAKKLLSDIENMLIF